MQSLLLLVYRTARAFLPKRAATLGVAAVAWVALAGCNNIFYYPSRRAHAVPPSPVHDVEIVSGDGTRLHGLYFPAKGGPARGTFVQFHGNAGNVTSHHRSLVWVVERGYHLLTFDYRGYGLSDGKPNPEGVHADALAAIRCAQRGLPRGGHAKDLILYGQSLGGAVMLRALAEAPRERLRAVVVEGSFHSYQEIAASVFWRTPILFPFTGFAYLLVSDRYAPSPFVSRIAPLPLLVVHGTEDPVVSYRFGRTLYHLAGEPKAFLPIPGGRHIDAMQREQGRYREALLDFVHATPRGKQQPAPELRDTESRCQLRSAKQSYFVQ